jgi:hypothetical protein
MRGCIHSILGEVVVVERRGASSTPQSYSSLSRVSEHAFGENLRLALYTTVPGADEALITELAGLGSVEAVSRNYIGVTASESHGREEALVGIDLRARLEDVEVKRKRYSPDDGLVEPDKPEHEDATNILVVDVFKQHAEDVCQAVWSGYSDTANNGMPLEVYCIYLAGFEGDLVDTFHYAKMLLEALEATPPPVAINLSVDFGVLCPKVDSNERIPELQTALYSIPPIDFALERLRWHGSAKSDVAKHRPPHVFAAAGNLGFASPNSEGLLQNRRLRLAYPASSIYTTAVTLVGVDDEDKNSFYLREEIPATYMWCPCIAVPDNSFEFERVGTSMASAHLAGAFAAHVSVQGNRCVRGGLLGQSSFIEETCTEKQLETYDRRVSVYSPNVDTAASGNPNIEVLEHLASEHPGYEFALFGSAAMRWSASFQIDGKRPSLKELVPAAWCQGSDLDLLYWGDSRLGERRQEIAEYVSEWFDDVAPAKAVDLQEASPTFAGLLMTQCTIPATQILLTRCGFIDVWGGREEIGNREVSIRLPSAQSWNLNHQYRSGVNGVLKGAVKWGQTVVTLASHLGLGGGDRLPFDRGSFRKLKQQLQSEPQIATGRKSRGEHSLLEDLKGLTDWLEQNRTDYTNGEDFYKFFEETVAGHVDVDST